MLISHSKKFIFIHVYKVAGTSIAAALWRYGHHKTVLNQLKSFSGIAPKIFCDQFTGHVTAKELKASLPNAMFQEYYKFAFVRNPWDWQVSLYNFMRKIKSHPQHKLAMSMDFSEYIDWRIENDKRLQSEMLFDQEGKILVDYVGRFEQLQNDFDVICNKLKIPTVQLQKLNTSNHDNYSKYYSEETRRKVGEAFALDIERFNYQFSNS